ncbi:MAG: glycosyltransferase family 4 protein [Hyphomicrobiales bacterium]|nr:glycosyltransferase family 4 protein [Hyphomicrobiales bacterium]
MKKNGPLRIAHVSFIAPPRVGGMQIVVDHLIREQQALGHDMTLVTRWRQWLAFRKENYPYRALPLLPRLPDKRKYDGDIGFPLVESTVFSLMYLFNRFDFVHVHEIYPAGWLLAPALRLLGIPFAMTSHGPDINTVPEINYGYRLYEKHDRRIRDFVPRAPCLTAISPSVREGLLALGADPARIVSVPNGVDFERIHGRLTDRRAVRDRLGWPQDTTVLASIGRHDGRKGFQFIPEMAAALAKSGRKFLWAVIGPETGAIEDMARTAGLGDVVVSHPPIGGTGAPRDRRFPPDELVDVYKAADMMVFPTLSEAAGLVIYEAMAAGLPIISTLATGVGDLIVDGVDGILCPIGDRGAMVQAIESLMDDPGRARTLAAAEIETARKHAWSAIAAQYVDLYRDMLAKRD